MRSRSMRRRRTCGTTSLEYLLVAVLVGLVAAAALAPIKLYFALFYDVLEMLTGLPLP